MVLGKDVVADAHCCGAFCNFHNYVNDGNGRTLLCGSGGCGAVYAIPVRRVLRGSFLARSQALDSYLRWAGYGFCLVRAAEARTSSVLDFAGYSVGHSSWDRCYHAMVETRAFTDFGWYRGDEPRNPTGRRSTGKS